MIKDKEVTSDGGSDYEDEAVRKLPSKNLNKTTSYSTPDANQAFTQLRQAFTKALIL